MTRIKFLAGFFLLLFGATSAFAAPEVVKVSFPSKEDNPVVSAFRQAFIPYVEEHCPGRFDIQVYPDGILGGSKQRIQSLRNGMIQMSSEASANVSQFAPDLSLLDLPYVVPGRAAMDKLFASPVGKKMLEPIRKNLHVHCLASILTTFRLLGSNRPGSTLEELKGLKVRTTSSREHMNGYNALGMRATPMPFSEVYTGLQQKVVEGVDMEVPSYVTNHYTEVAPNVIKADHVPVVFMLMVNDSFFNKLTDKEKAVWQEAARLYQQRVEKELEAYEEKALDDFAREPGVTVTRLSEQEKAKWKAAASKAYEQLSDEQKKTLAAMQEVMK